MSGGRAHGGLLLVVALAGATLLGLAAAPRAEAHIVPVGLGMQTFLKVAPTHVDLEYNLGYSEFAGFAEALKIEASRDDVIDEKEIEAFLDRLEKAIPEDLEVSMDGKRLSFRRMERKVLGLFAGTNVKEISGLAFDTWWTFRSESPVGPGEHAFTIHDRNFEKEISTPIIWIGKGSNDTLTYAFEPVPPQARYMDVGTEYQLFSRQARLYVEFQPSLYERLAREAGATSTAVVAGAASDASLPATVATAVAAPVLTTATAGVPSASPGMVAYAERSARESGLKIDYRGAEETEEARLLTELRGERWYLALVLALFWGAAHALAPGHGKSMVAAYLLGTQGRVRDALTLGGIVTVTHSVANFVIAVAVYLLAERVFGVNPNTAAGKVAVSLEAGGGAVVFLMGALLLYLRLLEAAGLRKGHAHSHSHGHGHGLFGHRHGPATSDADADARGLFALGVVAGFQPCTAGIALVFMSVAQGWLWKGLYLLLFFSLGLGVVILAVAVALVLSKALAGDRLKIERDGAFVRIMPVLSAAALTAVGAWMAIDCLARNKLGPFAHT